MATHETTDFPAGVIESFYGQPWSQAERLELFDWMADWGLNTYLYAPKDDLKHRAIWREAYSESEAETLGEIIQACRKRSIWFIYNKLMYENGDGGSGCRRHTKRCAWAMR